MTPTSSQPAAGQQAGATGRPVIVRRAAVLLFLVLAVVAVGLANITWFTSAQQTVTEQQITVSVTGHQGAPAITATALVSIAAALFLALSGRVAHWVAIAILALSGLLVAGSAVTLVLNPTSVLTSAVAEAIGVSAPFPQYATKPWGYATVVVGLAITAVAVLCALSVRNWPMATSKYERPTTQSGQGTQAASVTGQDLKTTSELAANQAASQGGGMLDERDAWDALSSGIDPTDGQEPDSPVGQ
ncbi:Trp biosynthesis-associated membrane protein [Jonesiaceae bacterium BS-20]|uniref:Trp biosynthesis-associated membrane protein n=1 Tax=Jonesiaceae bacterium BS-20 TaxID=3120821 RepID=A0AAU7DXC4_9MICO